jgi:hypothetical protein
MPAAVTAVHACGPTGPFIAGSADGTLRRIDGNGTVAWSASDPGVSIAALSANADASVVLSIVSSSATDAAGAVRILDGTGHPRWQVLAAPGWPIDARLSADGRSVLILRPARPPARSTVSLRDTATGAVRWTHEMPNAPYLVGDASPDLRFVVVGYVIQPAGSNEPSGLVQSYRDGVVVSDIPVKTPALPGLLGNGAVALAGYDGGIECRAWRGAGIGALRWHAAGGTPGIVLARGDRLSIGTYERIQSSEATVEATTVRVYDEAGAVVFGTELRATAPYLPTLSDDGRLLALVPRTPLAGEAPVLVSLDRPSRATTLPAGITAIGFGAGAGRMLVGHSDGTVSSAPLPR